MIVGEIWIAWQAKVRCRIVGEERVLCSLGVDTFHAKQLSSSVSISAPDGTRFFKEAQEEGPRAGMAPSADLMRGWKIAGMKIIFDAQGKRRKRLQPRGRKYRCAPVNVRFYSAA